MKLEVAVIIVADGEEIGRGAMDLEKFSALNLPQKAANLLNAFDMLLEKMVEDEIK